MKHVLTVLSLGALLTLAVWGLYAFINWDLSVWSWFAIRLAYVVNNVLVLVFYLMEQSMSSEYEDEFGDAEE